MPKVSAGGFGKFAGESNPGPGIVLGGTNGQKKVSPEVELLLGNKEIAPELLQRARDRQDEERDLRVLDAYNTFEIGLQEILNSPETGVMQRMEGAAQTATSEVNDYFAEEGGKLLDKLPDEEACERFMGILNSRRKTAINIVAQHQSQEYQSWKDKTARDTIDSVLRSVNMSPDRASLEHGERLLEGAVMRLYLGSNPAVLAQRLGSAKQAMFAGAIEAIGANDPISALIVAASWKQRFSEEAYAQLVTKLNPFAWNQSLKQEFAALRTLGDEEVEKNIKAITDTAMQDELREMLRADKVQQAAMAKKAEDDKLNGLNRALFQQYTEGKLNPEIITDSGLPLLFRQVWRKILERRDRVGGDGPFLTAVNGITSRQIVVEYQIYTMIAGGLGVTDAAMLVGLFGMRDAPQAKLIMNSLRDIADAAKLAGSDTEDHGAAVRDLLHRVQYYLQKGEVFSITGIRNEVIDDYFDESKRTCAGGTECSGSDDADGNAAADMADDGNLDVDAMDDDGSEDSDTENASEVGEENPELEADEEIEGDVRGDAEDSESVESDGSEESEDSRGVNSPDTSGKGGQPSEVDGNKI
ncbi:hypothetical protein [Maridesulfovibrio frigidus]|uniref:hypothetical protein n=1 Tax=Maridesulfovibrio frigidus TaxID=340956 RepID=UPI00068ECFD7|nr:hypothetical protein [Maridesulfovibrio frigidus]